MIEFKGVVSDEVRAKEIKTQANSFKMKMLIGTIISFILLLFVVLTKTVFSGESFSFSQLFNGNVTLLCLLLFVVFLVMLIVGFVKPMHNSELDKKMSFSVALDNDKIVYTPENGFGKREISYANLKKIVDEGSHYVLVSKEHNLRFLCEKDLLVQGSLSEFDNYFNKIIVRSGNLPDSKNVKGQEVNAQTANENGEVINDNSNINENVEKTFTNEKFKKSKTRNEKSFKFAIIGVILGVLSVAITPVVVKFGVNFAINTISYVFNGLFNGFVVELFTFLLACLFVLIIAVILFPACVLVMPVLALLSLIFPIYQLVAVNRRWFSWVALVVGILSIGGCLLIAITTVQTL